MAQRKVMHLILYIVVIYIIAVLLVYLIQRSLLYYPHKNLRLPDHYNNLDMEVVPLTTADNITITTWYHPPQNNKPTVVYFHGNAGHLGYRAAIFQYFIDAGYGVLGVSYRGFGTSEGSPNEAGLYEDARTAIKFVQQKTANIILFGESLGTGVATQMATEFSITLLVLEAPFISIGHRAQEIYFWLPAKYMTKDRFDNVSKIDNINTAVLIIHGEKDRVVPIHHGRTLFEKAKDPKHALFYEHLAHNDFASPHIVNEITKFLESIDEYNN